MERVIGLVISIRERIAPAVTKTPPSLTLAQIYSVCNTGLNTITQNLKSTQTAVDQFCALQEDQAAAAVHSVQIGVQLVGNSLQRLISDGFRRPRT